MKKLNIERTFNASISNVWKAFTDPALLKKWWAPDGMESSFTSVDLRKGGLFRFCFKTSDGTEYWGRGEYQSIVEPNFISYLDTFSDTEGNSVPPSMYGMPGDEIVASLVEIKFNSDRDKTLMSITMDNTYDEAMTNDMTNGWNSMFDKLEQII